MIRKLAVIIILLIASLAPVSAIQYDLVYDDNGNLVEGTHHYYEYDEFNQLVRVRDGGPSGSIIAEYAYDHEGNRVKKVTYDGLGNAETTYYASKEFVRVDDTSGSEETVFYHDGLALVGRKDSNGDRFFYHPNHLGSTHIVTDFSGAVVEETNYLPFGLVFEGGASRFLFTGQEKDPESALMYYNARYYDPFLRHFTQPDTILPDIYDPQQLNRYSYVMNNPVKYVDPTGHCVFACVGDAALLTGFAIVALAAIIATTVAVLTYEYLFPSPTQTIDQPIHDGYDNPYSQPLETPGGNPFIPGNPTIEEPGFEDDLPYLFPGSEITGDVPFSTRESNSLRKKFERLPTEESNPFTEGPAFYYRTPKHIKNIDEVYKKGRFVDDLGNLWKWHEKSGHFDVTHPKTGKHINVDTDGVIRHGKNKIPKEFKRQIRE